MANRAYVSFWTRDNSTLLMLDRFERFLETVPLSSKGKGFWNLTVRAVNPSETPIAEHDLARANATPSDVITLVREYLNADCAYEVEASWDLWRWDAEKALWEREPERLLLACQGSEYDEGVSRTSGDILADVGLEHLYTGHGDILASREPLVMPADPMEAEFLERMSRPENLHEYQQKTRENIQQLMQWVQAVERALPIDRLLLWSEGEENLEARLDEILAVH